MILFRDLAEFMQSSGQIILALAIPFCISGLLLIAAIYLAVRSRRRKALARAAEAGSVPAVVTTQADAAEPALASSERVPEFGAASAASVADDDDDLPDLNMLVDTSALQVETPEPPAAPLAAQPQPVLVTTPAPVLAPAPREPIGKPYLPRRDEQRIKLRTGETIDAKEVLTILRDPRDGRLVVLMDSVGYRTLVDSPDAKEKFVKLMRELSDVVTKPDTPPVPTETIATADEPETPMTLTSEVQRQTRTTAAVPPPPIDEKGRVPGDLPTYKVEEAVKPQKGGLFSARPKYEAQPIPELNIAAAIEAYLQHKLQYTPEFEGRSIHVLAAPGGGVRIQVDGRNFEAVGDVDDAEIRAFLAETIQEWQQRQ